MTGIDPYDAWQAVLKQHEGEFAALPEEAREAALEYARGLGRQHEPEPLQEGDVPEFIIVGLEGRRLFYSASVTTSRFLRRMTGVNRVPIAGRMARLPQYAIMVGVEMRDFEQIIGDNYQDALRTLLEEQARKAATDRAIRELPPGI